MMRECPCSTKTREGLGNPSPPPSRFPLGFCTPRPREISPRAAIIDYCCLAGSNHCCLAKPSSSPATCRLCEYQCCLAGNNDLHSIAVDSAWWINAACQATIVNNSRSGAQGISTNIALPAGGCCYETMLLPRTSKQGKETTLKIVAFGPSALRQQFSMSSLSPVLRYVIIIHCSGRRTRHSRHHLNI